MKTVFLTGGSSGIGQTFKQHLEQNSYEVIAPTRAELDLSDFNIDDVDLRSYDYLILCAGVDANGRIAFHKMSEDDFLDTINVNLVSNMKLIHKYLRQRIFKPWSKVIVVGSDIVDGVYAEFGAYGTSKIALEAFVSTIRLETKNNNIGFTVIHPGLTKTNFHYNRGNVAEENRNELYDSMPHMTVDELIPIFDQILNDEHHRIKKIHLSA
jgi:NADP-dependent 3-hydroxy acid dehydrogenase YdfG